ncbi:hypothetical protein GCM10027610_059720 [Dactylosporangium cerinum]
MQDHLVAGDEHVHVRPGMHLDPLDADLSGGRGHRRRHHPPGGREQFAGHCVLAGPPDVGPRGPRSGDGVTAPVAVLVRQHRLGTGGDAGTGGDLDRVAGRQPRRRIRITGERPADDLPRSGAGDRVAVHRGGVEGRRRRARPHRCREQVPHRVADRQRHRRQRPRDLPRGGVGLRPGQAHGPARVRHRRDHLCSCGGHAATAPQRGVHGVPFRVRACNQDLPNRIRPL